MLRHLLPLLLIGCIGGGKADTGNTDLFRITDIEHPDEIINNGERGSW